MDNSSIHILPLSQRPCVVQYLEEYNKFIIGTYELLPTIETARLKLAGWIGLDDDVIRKKLESLNNRAGKLILIDGAEDPKTTRIEYEFECEIGGGVFDIKVRYEEVAGNYSLHVAHSNGIIGLYILSLDRGNKISLKEHTTVSGSIMLTSIDLFPDFEHSNNQSGDVSPRSDRSQSFSPTPATQSPLGFMENLRSGNRGILLRSPTHDNLRLVVGDSIGNMTVLNRSFQTRIDVAKGDSIWQVKSLRLTSNRYIILVGAENSSWYIYGFEEHEEGDKLSLLYKNCFKDFSAGVTSITLLDTMHLQEYDLFEILLGSYDETLQMYHIKINNEATSKPDVCHKHTLSIEDGGIWRVKPIRASASSLSQNGQANQTAKFSLCLAAMYAGSYTLSLASLICPRGRLSMGAGEGKITKLVDLNSLNLAEKPLHYDIDVTTTGSAYCIADFNNSLCLIKTVQV